MLNSLGDTYEEFVENHRLYYESAEAEDRVLIAGYFYETGAPLTDEILATQEYIRRKSLGLIDTSETKNGHIIPKVNVNITLPKRAEWHCTCGTYNSIGSEDPEICWKCLTPKPVTTT